MIKFLDELTEQEIQALRIQTAKKPVLVVVHPHHNTGKNKALDRFLKGKKWNKYIKIVTVGPTDAPPLIQHLGKIINPADEVYVVRTVKNNQPEPIMGWTKFKRILKELHAKRVLVSGRKLQEDSSEQARRMLEYQVEQKQYRQAKQTARFLVAAKRMGSTNTLGACAGYTATKLAHSRDFRVKFVRKFT